MRIFLKSVNGGPADDYIVDVNAEQYVCGFLINCPRKKPAALNAPVKKCLAAIRKTLGEKRARGEHQEPHIKVCHTAIHTAYCIHTHSKTCVPSKAVKSRSEISLCE